MAVKQFRQSRADRASKRPRASTTAFSTSDSTAITGTQEAQANFDNSYTIPANQLRVGSRIRFQGYIKHTATTGAETHSALAVIGSLAVLTVAAIDPADNNCMWIEVDVSVRSVGASGTIYGVAKYRAVGAAGTAGNEQVIVIDGSTLDTTAANTCALAIDRQGTATDSDSAKVPYFLCEVTL